MAHVCQSSNGVPFRLGNARLLPHVSTHRNPTIGIAVPMGSCEARAATTTNPTVYDASCATHLFGSSSPLDEPALLLARVARTQRQPEPVGMITIVQHE